MNSILININKNVFNEELVIRTMYRYSGKYYVSHQSSDNYWTVSLIPKINGYELDNLVNEFNNDILDEKIRQIVRLETAGVAELLLKTALQNSINQDNEI
jgi:His-Xaa-Ser system protein HxsD